MKLEKSTLGGFENPSKGWHAFEVSDRVEFVVVNDEATTTIAMFCNVIDDDEEGRSSRASCDLSTPGGRTSFARFLYFTKVATALEKETGAGGDLTEVEWGDKFLDVTQPKCAKLVDSAINKLPGKVFKGKIDHREGKGRNKEGETITRMYANFVDLAMYGDKTDKAPVKEPADTKGKKADSGEW